MGKDGNVSLGLTSVNESSTLQSIGNDFGCLALGSGMEEGLGI